MQTKDFDNLLRDSLEDHRLSRKERKAIRAWVSEQSPGPDQLAVLRHRVFQIARQWTDEVEPAKLVDWIEKAVTALATPTEAADTFRPSRARFSPGEECLRTIRGLIGGARQTLDVCVFTITDNRISETLIDAHNRGVAVRIVTDNDKVYDMGNDHEMLLRAGIPCRVDVSPYHMHHKYCVADRTTLLTGSYNWTRSAAVNNEENIVVMYESKTVNAFNEHFETLWRSLEGS